MSNVTTDRFLELVKKSGLLEEERLQQFLDRLAEERGSAVLEDAHAVADALITAQLLTQWQANKLLAGKHKGFRLGKYKLLDQIGKGGMSSVYLAEHLLMRRSVAIKVLPQNRVEDATYLDRFRLEARAVAKMDDPHIVRAYDIDNEGTIHYIVMEYVDGRDLHQIVSDSGPVDFITAADYIAQAADGLQHAHEMGLVHRDVKPANCLVDRFGTLKILDLGLARVLEDEAASLTVGNQENVLGTADYLAPEQALNSHKADSRADIYGLGCTLYFLLTGQPPFPEGSISERLLKHQTAQPESILKFRPDAPPSLVNICSTMMLKKPEQRYQTAGEVAKLLTEWLAEHGRAPGGRTLEEAAEGGSSSLAVGRESLAGSIGLHRKAAPFSPAESGVARFGPNRPKESSGVLRTTKASFVDDDLVLAPLEEDSRKERGKRSRGSSGKEGSKAGSDSSKSMIDTQDLSAEVTSSGPARVASPSSKSLIEEELEAAPSQIAQRSAAHSQFNPLQPPGYQPKKDPLPVGLFIALGAAAVFVIGVIIVLVVTTGG